MKYNIYILSLLILFLSSCEDKVYKPKGLTKLSDTEIIERAKQQIVPDMETVVYKNEKGEIITADSIQKIPNMEEWTADSYVDASGVLKELVLRKATQKDKELQQELIKAYSYQPPPPIELVDIDCERKQEILQEVYDSDQGMRTKGETIKPDVDRQNLVTIISLIEKCGMPTTKEVSEKQMSAIWLVFQHGDHANLKKYFPLLEQSAKIGDLRAVDIAMMKDRILMGDGQPQIYGTQLTKKGDDWVLYDLANPETVNKRRAELGFEPLEDYLKRLNIEFNVEQVK